MNVFGINISRAKAAPDIATRPQYAPSAGQGPLTPYFQDYYLRKVGGDFYEALREGIPVIDSAIRRLISLNGTIRIIGDNPALVKELEDFILNVPVNDHQKGIHAFLECFCNEMFEQGFSMPEFVATAKMDDIAELRVPDSKQIIFRRNAAGKSEPWYRHFNGVTPAGLVYNSPQTLVERILTATYGQVFSVGSGFEEKLNPANKLYFSINNENTDPYGVSIMRSMEFCAKVLMTMQNSQLHVWERFGDPSYHVKYKTNKKDLGADTLESRRSKIQTDFSSAIRAKRGGKSADFVSAVSADADMEISVIGHDGQILEMEVPARHVLEQLVSKTNLPAWMLGIYWSTTERMATLEVEAALQDAKVRQLAMLPELIRLFSVFLRLRGRNWKSVTTSLDKPGDWGIIFETPNLRDMVAQAQARFLNAQADQMQSTAADPETREPVPKKGHKAHSCECGGEHHGKKIYGVKEIERPQPWLDLDAVENGYEAQIKEDWFELQQRVFTIAKLDPGAMAVGMATGKDSTQFTFSVEQRASVLAVLNDFIGEYSPASEDSPVSWYYGQAYSLGLIRAAQMIGQDRPILDLIKNAEIFAEMVKGGFDLVKNNATKAIKDKILVEIQAHVIAGTNPLNVAERLKKLFGDQNASWERLARTEMSSAAEKAKLHEWAAWEVEKVEFTPAPDACPICVAMAGDYVVAECPVPGPDTHPRCRCSIRPAESEVGKPRTREEEDTFVPAKNIVEAATWAMANGLADAASYKGAVVSVANEWNRGVFEHVKQFPELRKNFKFIGTTQERQRRYVDLRLVELKRDYPNTTEKYLLARARREAGKTPGNVFAYSTSDRLAGGVSVNSKYGGNVEKFVHSLQESVKTNFHPPGCDTVKSVIDHEIAHQLDALLDIRNSFEFKAILAELTTTGKTIDAEISRYARYNAAETIAEAWAEYRNSDNPRPMATKIGQLIEKQYKMKFGG